MSAAKELVALGIPYTQENFEKAVDNGDINALTLFLKAGHSANEIAARGGDPVAGLAVAHNKRNLAQELNLFVGYGLDFKLTGHFNNFGHLLSELLHRPVTQEEILLYQAQDADTAKIIIAAGADPTTLLNGLRKLKQAHTLPNWAQSRLAALETAAPNVSFDPPLASAVDASKFDVRGIKLGMTAGQVLDAAKASSMTAQQFTITNNKAETGVVLRDITAAHIEGTPSQQVKAAVTGGSSVPLRSGLKLVAWISAKDHTVMEIEARNAGVDASENDAGGQLYSVGVQNGESQRSMGRPSRQAQRSVARRLLIGEIQKAFMSLGSGQISATTRCSMISEMSALIAMNLTSSTRKQGKRVWRPHIQVPQRQSFDPVNISRMVHRRGRHSMG